MTAPEMTPLRCDRCRAVFSLDLSVASNAVAVQCARCQFVFERATPNELGTGGRLGGAALSARQDSATPIPPPRSRRAPVIAALLGIVTLAVAAIGVGRVLTKVTPPSEALSLAPARFAAGEALLWRDDQASLEAAIAAFSEAEALDTQRDRAQAERALATMLLGLSLRAEQTHFSVLARTPEQTRQLEAQAMRGERLVREGAALAEDVANRDGLVGSWPVIRAQLLARAVNGQSPEGGHPVVASVEAAEPNAAAWVAFVRAVAGQARTDGINVVDAQVKELEAALRLSPSFRRVQWTLAAVLASKEPSERSRAEHLADELLRTNPDHELATRLKAVLVASSTP